MLHREFQASKIGIVNDKKLLKVRKNKKAGFGKLEKAKMLCSTLIF